MSFPASLIGSLTDGNGGGANPYGYTEETSKSHFFPVSLLYNVRRKAKLHLSLVRNSMLDGETLRKLIEQDKLAPADIVKQFPLHEQLVQRLHDEKDSHIRDTALGLSAMQLGSTSKLVAMMSSAGSAGGGAESMFDQMFKVAKHDASQPTVQGTHDPDSMRITTFQEPCKYDDLFAFIKKQAKNGELQKLNANWPTDDQACVKEIKDVIDQLTKRFELAARELDYRQIVKSDVDLCMSIHRNELYALLGRQANASKISFEQSARFMDNPALCSTVLLEDKLVKLGRNVRQALRDAAGI